VETIALEFRHEPGNLAANGTDTVTFLDGRWGPSRRAEHVYRKVAELRELRGSKYRGQLFVGYTVLGRSDYSRPQPHVEMPDLDPPRWAAGEAE